MAVRLYGVTGEIPPLSNQVSNGTPEAGPRTVLGRQFDWGGRLPNSNGGARRSPRAGWKSAYECKGTRWLDCESDRTSRYESRS
jgi:hypothetical protein